MLKQKTLLVIAASLVIIGALGVLFTFKSSGVGEEINKTEVIDNPNIMDIEIESDNAAIEVLPAEDDVITITFTAKESDHNKYKFKVKESGDKLSISLNEKLMRFINFHLDFDFTAPVITVQLPKKQYDELIVDNVNGKIIVENIDVQFITAKTTNGRIELEETNTDSTTVSSDNGSIVLKHVNGTIKSNVVNGKTTLITDNLDRSIELESVNGKIDIQTASEPTNATIEIDVVNGKVDLFGNKSRSQVFGDGEHRIKLKTVNGGVTVSK